MEANLPKKLKFSEWQKERLKELREDQDNKQKESKIK